MLSDAPMMPLRCRQKMRYAITLDDAPRYVKIDARKIFTADAPQRCDAKRWRLRS